MFSPPPVICKTVSQTGLFSLDYPTSLGEGKLALLRLKIGLVVKCLGKHIHKSVYTENLLQRSMCSYTEHSTASDGEATVLKKLEMLITPKLQLFPCQVLSRMEVSVRVPSIGQINLFESY